jgi:uncharacterized protein YukE
MTFEFISMIYDEVDTVVEFLTKEQQALETMKRELRTKLTKGAELSWISQTQDGFSAKLGRYEGHLEHMQIQLAELAKALQRHGVDTQELDANIAKRLVG